MTVPSPQAVPADRGPGGPCSLPGPGFAICEVGGMAVRWPGGLGRAELSVPQPRRDRQVNGSREQTVGLWMLHLSASSSRALFWVARRFWPNRAGSLGPEVLCDCPGKAGRGCLERSRGVHGGQLWAQAPRQGREDRALPRTSSPLASLSLGFQICKVGVTLHQVF